MAMINLIPSSQKKSMAYARRNSMILKWLVIMLVAIAGLLVIFGGSLFYIKQDIKAHENSIKSGQKSLSDQDEQKTLERVSEISGRLSLVVDVLSKEVIFSKLLPHIDACKVLLLEQTEYRIHICIILYKAGPDYSQLIKISSSTFSHC